MHTLSPVSLVTDIGEGWQAVGERRATAVGEVDCVMSRGLHSDIEKNRTPCSGESLLDARALSSASRCGAASKPLRADHFYNSQRSGRLLRCAYATTPSDGESLKKWRIDLFSAFFSGYGLPAFLPTTWVSSTMSALEALHAIVTSEDSPQIIRDHIVDSLQFALRNQPGFFTTKEVQWLAQWDDTRIPIAATKILNEMKTS